MNAPQALLPASATLDLKRIAEIRQEATQQGVSLVSLLADKLGGNRLQAQAELAHALKVVRAAELNLSAGVGAFTVDGRLVDGPFITEAKNLLALASRLGLTP